MKICFLVGSMDISGGTYVIVQHASHLHDLGHEVTLAVQSSFTPATMAWHDKAPKLRYLPFETAQAESYDYVIGTWWRTALELGKFKAHHYAYFVQSIESRFYSEVEVPLRQLVESTYRLPVHFITEAAWIGEHLKKEFGHHCAIVKNGIRKDVYASHGETVAPRVAGKPRVLVEGHFGVPFKNTALAIRLAREAGARDIWVLTGSEVKRLPWVSRVFSKVPILSTSQIYRSCDILLKLSTVEGMFGPPLEMFHCGGTAVVFNVTGHEEYIVDRVNARVVSPQRLDDAVSAVSSLMNNSQELERLKLGALETAAAWPSWEESSSQFHDWLLSLADSATTKPDALLTMSAEAWDSYRKNEVIRLNKIRKTPLSRMSGALTSLEPDVLKRLWTRTKIQREVLFGIRRAY